jgi:hypothetical protein
MVINYRKFINNDYMCVSVEIISCNSFLSCYSKIIYTECNRNVHTASVV